MKKKKILFLCTGNSCRSQMAEGLARFYYADKFEIYSAGIEAHGMNALAMKVMQEIGIDMTKQYSKKLDELGDIDFDTIYTVCGHANENCPLWLKKGQVKHVGFPDPPKMAAGLANEEEVLDCYRKVRDQIKEWILKL